MRKLLAIGALLAAALLAGAPRADAITVDDVITNIGNHPLPGCASSTDNACVPYHNFLSYAIPVISGGASLDVPPGKIKDSANIYIGNAGPADRMNCCSLPDALVPPLGTTDSFGPTSWIAGTGGTGNFSDLVMALTPASGPSMGLEPSQLPLRV